MSRADINIAHIRFQLSCKMLQTVTVCQKITVSPKHAGQKSVPHLRSCRAWGSHSVSQRETGGVPPAAALSNAHATRLVWLWCHPVDCHHCCSDLTPQYPAAKPRMAPVGGILALHVHCALDPLRRTPKHVPSKRPQNWATPYYPSLLGSAK